MPTHGRARQTLIEDLQSMAPKLRTGSAMSAIQGAVSDTGQMPAFHRDQYNFHRDNNDVAYTVKSYDTVIGYVTRYGQTIVPNVTYSVTTTHHQHLCRVYLNGGESTQLGGQIVKVG